MYLDETRYDHKDDPYYEPIEQYLLATRDWQPLDMMIRSGLLPKERLKAIINAIIYRKDTVMLDWYLRRASEDGKTFKYLNRLLIVTAHTGSFSSVKSIFTQVPSRIKPETIPESIYSAVSRLLESKDNYPFLCEDRLLEPDRILLVDYLMDRLTIDQKRTTVASAFTESIYSAQRGELRMVEYMVKLGTELGINFDYQTALEIAIFERQSKTLKYLLSLRLSQDILQAVLEQITDDKSEIYTLIKGHIIA